MISNEQYANLKSQISIRFEEIYKKRVDSSIGNGILLDKIKDDRRDAYSKGKLSEQHYKLLIEKVSDSKNN